MSASADDDEQQSALLADGANADSRVAEDERLVAAAELVAAAARKVALDHKCSTLGDAEEVCVQLFVEIVEDMFMEMQVLDENERCFAMIAHFSVDRLFDGVQMGGVQANESLDRVEAVDAPTRASTDVTMQQILKPGDDADSDEREEAAATRRPKKPKVSRNHPRAAPLEFLWLLTLSLEKHQRVATAAFLEFPATTYATAAATHSARGGRQYHNNKPSDTGGGTWTIPASELGGFLQHFIATSNLSVLPSAVQFVAEANRGALEMRKKQKTPPRLTLAQVQLCVQKAAFAAEEALHELEQIEQQRGKALQAALSAKSDSLKIMRVFQTEVLQTIGNAASKEAQHSCEDPDDDLPLVCYLDENDPVPPPIDRNAPSSLAKKPAASSKHGIARKVLLAMKPGPGKNSKWLSLRTKVLVKDSNTTELSIEADMSLSASGSFNGDKIGQQLSPAGSVVSQQTLHPQLSKKKSSATTASGAGKNLASDKKPPPSFSIEPDAAALSNIFSLGTPRQMNADELARRNDILALLEREEMKNERRMANASIAAMSMPVASNLSETDKTYQAYVAANSVITAPLSQAQAVFAQSGGGGDHASPQPPTALSPKRPEKKNASHQHRELMLRTKFDLEREPPGFIVSDGNAHVRDELSALERAMCSPIKRSKGRGVREQQQLPQPPFPAAIGLNNDSHAAAASPIKVSEHHDPHRPIQTASSHLPQLETSRLAVGVRAVVRGVEKRGPQRSPSRKSRLKLHNYNTREEAKEVDDEEQELHDSPPSPIRREQPAASGSFLPLIPPVSPIKASPHRKQHVKFHGNTATENDEPSVAAKESASNPSPERRPSPAKQPVWDKKTSSPPRVRNRHFAPGSTSKAQKFHPFLFRSGAVGDDVEEENDVDDEAENLFKPRIEAPRRSYLPVDDRA